jgi:phosphoribosylglycinamide formyltransferase-1
MKMEEREKNTEGAKAAAEPRDRLHLALIASGSGTDADSIMTAWENGCIPEIHPPILISTKKDAGCLEKAERHGLQRMVVDFRSFADPDRFNQELAKVLQSFRTDLVFLVGCIHKIYPVEGTAMYNIHPADPHRHGGDKMYGLAVHEHVLKEILDLLSRGKRSLKDPFYTFPTVHEVTLDYDGGDMLLRQAVRIPSNLIQDLFAGKIEITEAAKALQQWVLPYEWLMLPAAVRMAARRILEERKGPS